MAPIKSTEIGEWWKSFEINIKGSLIVAQGFLPHAAKDAKVVYLTTAVATLGPLPGGSAYASSKLGATKVFEYLQAENPDLRVISVHPGVLQTEMQDKLIDDGISMPQHESESLLLLSLLLLLLLLLLRGCVVFVWELSCRERWRWRERERELRRDHS